MDDIKLQSAHEPIVGGILYNQMQADNWPTVALIGYALSMLGGALNAWLGVEFLAWWSSPEVGDF